MGISGKSVDVSDFFRKLGGKSQGGGPGWLAGWLAGWHPPSYFPPKRDPRCAAYFLKKIVKSPGNRE